MRRWRSDLPPGFHLAFVAPHGAIHSDDGHLLRGDDLKDAALWLAEATRALEAFALVLPVSGAVTPGKRDRDRLRAYFDAVQAPDFDLVWHPTGLWEPPTALSFALSCGLTYTCDPLEHDLPPASLSYARLHAIGARTRLGDGLLYDLSDRLSVMGRDEIYVAIDSNRAHREAVRLHALASELELGPPDEG
jgi:uncharacterized protein YecE (DUF72 family)